MAQTLIFELVKLHALCDILADTSTGLTNSEIGQLLRACGIADIGAAANKRTRLFQSLAERQSQDKCGNNVIAFIQCALDPVRYIGRQQVFEDMRASINHVLGFSGYAVGEDGRLREIQAARTLSEAEQRASRLRRELQNRNVHVDVLRFCRAELLADDYFHAVFEAAKSVADKVRDKAGMTYDGSYLVDQAFGASGGLPPLLVFNPWQTETERNEHTGLMNLMKGVFGLFRNTTAHAPRIKWVIKEQDAYDMLTLVSLVHRRLDEAVRTR
jgi:uncharacterized protein (TIGR02391 family)